MSVSVFDMFSVGIGPSSSHTVGPMRAALRFALGLLADAELAGTAAVKIELFGSLGATGRGYGSDTAVLLGLEGETPEGVEIDTVEARVAAIRAAKSMRLLGKHAVRFVEKRHLVLHKRQSLPGHPNGMRFTAFDASGFPFRERVYYSVGGGFVVDEAAVSVDRIVEDRTPLPHKVLSGADLLAECEEHGLSISEIAMRNEMVWRSEAEIRAGLLDLWRVMDASVKRGCAREGILPGGLKVKRRAAAMHRRLLAEEGEANDPMGARDWVNLFALVVHEENAAGGRGVTAPINGAAGIIPAVLSYYVRFAKNPSEDGIVRFLLTADTIGMIYKTNASISGAEVGCQGEVGMACSMAAAGLAELRGGTPAQVENAAEIGMEHNLGLTCDPVGGLVQVPCIECNTMGAIKAIDAARLAMQGDGRHHISLDKVIATMWQTGVDMKRKYKETSRGGLAVNILEC
jgi:L-serine dehydratase